MGNQQSIDDKQKVQSSLTDAGESRLLQNLLDMGFDSKLSRKAINKFGDNMDQCIDFLSNVSSKGANEDISFRNKQKSQANDPIELRNMLAVIINIADYDNFPCASKSKDRIMTLKDLLKNRYKYDVVYNDSSYMTITDLEDILYHTKRKFRDVKYDGIIVIYSGYFTRDKLLLSNCTRKLNKIATMDRKRFESFFDDYNLPTKQNAIKLYFMASQIRSSLEINNMHMAKACIIDDNAAADGNRFTMFVQQPFSVYETEHVNNIFIECLYCAFNQNANSQFKTSFMDFQDSIKSELDFQWCPYMAVAMTTMTYKMLWKMHLQQNQSTIGTDDAFYADNIQEQKQQPKQCIENKSNEAQTESENEDEEKEEEKQEILEDLKDIGTTTGLDISKDDKLLLKQVNEQMKITEMLQLIQQLQSALLQKNKLIQQQCLQIQRLQSKQPVHVVCKNIVLDKVLVIVICVGEYNKKDLNNLPGTQTDKDRLVRILCEKYNYDVMVNKSPKVTRDDMEDILFAAKKRFRKKKYEYNCIMVFFSGHGSSNFVLLTDFVNENQYDGTFPRTELEFYFNKIMEKSGAYKMYFIDSCRGKSLSKVHLKEEASGLSNVVGSKGDYVHEAENTAVIYSNSDSFKSYEVPYDEKNDDIHEFNENNYMSFDDGPKCSIFMNAVCKTLDGNVEKEFGICYSKLEDMISRKAKATIVPMRNNYQLKIGQIAWPGGSIENDEKQRILFKNGTRKGEIVWFE
eukprot:251307_1